MLQEATEIISKAELLPGAQALRCTLPAEAPARPPR